MIKTLDDYTSAIQPNRFDEFPAGIGAGMTMMEDFINYNEIDTRLKIHLSTVILKRNFSSLDGHQVLMDPQWLIVQFLSGYQKELIKPWLTETIGEAMKMIISPHTFTKGIIATTFMFGVVEYYAKHFLGWRPWTVNTFDPYHEPCRKMFIGETISKLKKQIPL